MDEIKNRAQRMDFTEETENEPLTYKQLRQLAEDYAQKFLGI